jgi:hypothetical protein
MGVVFSEPLLSNGRVTGRLEGVVSLAGAVEAHSEWKSALREYASEYVPVRTTAATSKVSPSLPQSLSRPLSILIWPLSVATSKVSASHVFFSLMWRGGFSPASPASPASLSSCARSR